MVLPGIARRDANYLVVPAFFIGHPKHSDGPAVDLTSGKRGFLYENQRIEWIAVCAQRFLYEAVIGWILSRGEQGAVQPDSPSRVVDLIFVALAFRYLDGDVELHALTPCSIRTQRCESWRRNLLIVRNTRFSIMTLAVLIAVVFGSGTTYVVLRHAGNTTDAADSKCLAPCFSHPSRALGLAPNKQAPELPTEAGLASALSSYLDRSELGSLAATVIDQRTAKVLWQYRGGALMVPASVSKLVTATAALATLGPQYRLATDVVSGKAFDEVVLVGGGDVTLTKTAEGHYPGAARLDDLAAQVRRAHPQPIHKLVVDSSAYSGPELGEGWDSDVVTGGYGVAVTPLATDGGRVDPADEHRVERPDLATGFTLAKLLAPREQVDVQVKNDRPAEMSSTIPGLTGAQLLGEVKSPPVARLVEVMLSESDNVIAESLARQTALARGDSASFGSAAAAEVQTLHELGINVDGVKLSDGSGLSRDNRLTASMLAQLIQLAGTTRFSRLRAILTGLPVAGFSGTLHDRFRRTTGTSGTPDVRAKTGSLSQVSSLVGMVTTADGARLSVAVVANGFDKTGAQAAKQTLDRFVAVIANCGCR